MHYLQNNLSLYEVITNKLVKSTESDIVQQCVNNDDSFFYVYSDQEPLIEKSDTSATMLVLQNVLILSIIILIVKIVYNATKKVKKNKYNI